MLRILNFDSTLIDLSKQFLLYIVTHQIMFDLDLSFDVLKHYIFIF